MSTPAVSVIIPTHNRAGWVVQAVESVLKQSFDDWELIVVDDGSSDETWAVLKPFRDRIRYLYQSNRGVSSARNLGLKKAEGEWLAFLDSDDLWMPEKLERQMDFFSNHPEALICQTAELWLRNGRRVNPRKKHQKFSGDIFAPSLKLCLVSPSAVMIHRDLFQKVGFFDESFPACEDYDLWLRISARHPIYLMDQTLVIKRGGHPDQLSRTIPSLDRLRIQALIKLIKSGELTMTQTGLVLQELESKCRIYGQGCIKRGKNEEGQYYLQLPFEIRKDIATV
jgi:glycosyltransferase involved in cell wall biosynthesis